MQVYQVKSFLFLALFSVIGCVETSSMSPTKASFQVIEFQEAILVTTKLAPGLVEELRQTGTHSHFDTQEIQVQKYFSRHLTFYDTNNEKIPLLHSEIAMDQDTFECSLYYRKKSAPMDRILNTSFLTSAKNDHYNFHDIITLNKDEVVVNTSKNQPMALLVDAEHKLSLFPWILAAFIIAINLWVILNRYHLSAIG